MAKKIIILNWDKDFFNLMEATIKHEKEMKKSQYVDNCCLCKKKKLGRYYGDEFMCNSCYAFSNICDICKEPFAMIHCDICGELFCESCIADNLYDSKYNNICFNCIQEYNEYCTSKLFTCPNCLKRELYKTSNNIFKCWECKEEIK